MAGSFDAQAASHVESLVQWKRREGAAANGRMNPALPVLSGSSAQA